MEEFTIDRIEASTIDDLDDLVNIYVRNYHWRQYQTKILESGIDVVEGRYYALITRLTNAIQ